ncbi:MAG: hypothetical protein V3S13_03415, partial [Candidatus Omnitrophota bacterium]
MELTAEAIYGFTTSLLLSRFDNPKPTPAFHKELWELACRPESKVAIAAPRGHAKSTAITHSYTLASVLFRQAKFVLVVSDTEGQAVQFLGDIKRELIENDDLISLFGLKRKLVKDTESVVIAEFEDGTQFRIDAKGSEQKLRGTKWRNTRPDLIVGDDLENDEIVLNEERRDKFRRWFFNALLPAGGDHCKIRVVGTILHMDSLLERLMPPWGGEHTKTDGIKFWIDEEYRKENETPWLSIRYQAHSPDFSQMLWPEKFSQKRLRNIRLDYVQQGFPEGYSQEYLNYPIDEENAIFKAEDFLPITDMEDNLEYYVGCDLAISERDKAAFTVMVVAGIDHNGVLKIVDVRRFRGDSLEIVDELFSLQKRYTPELFIIEKENIARSIGPFLTQEMGRRNIYMNIDDPTPSQDKVKRAQ